VIVNPIAGMGGPVGLKGTDGPEMLREARRRGAIPRAPQRADRALARLSAAGGELHVLAGAGALGADVATANAFSTETIGAPARAQTDAEDTRRVALAMLERGVELLLFAGGDGTLRDIYDVVGSELPLVGVPTGAKMHSGAFAASPEAAGAAVAAHLRRAPADVRLCDREVADVDEDALRRGHVGTRLYGRVSVPEERTLMVGSKAAGPGSATALDALARELAAEMQPGRTYLLGPGTSTARVMRHLGLAPTLLGVDVVRDRRLLASDATADELAELVDPSASTLIVGVVGGQGFLFGRGNQQISPDVIRRVGAENVVVIADAAKLHALAPCVLRVDTGERRLDRELSGYRRVHVAPGVTTVVKTMS
jgi:predicted polyphosphate/ATP-dependent NAD kinase